VYWYIIILILIACVQLLLNVSLLFFFLFAFPQNVEDDFANNYSNKPIVVVGHRGALYQELENTREGFNKSAEMGCHAVELDVFVLKCGSLIVFHGGGTDENPGDLIDYCNTVGSILDLTYQEALELKFNPKFEEFPCPASSIMAGSIPTLEQVLQDAKKNGLHVKIELKGPGTVEPTLEVVERLEMLDQCSFSSFDKDRLAVLRQLRPQVDAENGQFLYKTGAIFDHVPEDYLEQAKKSGANEIHLRYDTCTAPRIQEIHNEGFGSMAWFRGPRGMGRDTVEKYWDVGNEDESMYETLLRTGVQQLCVNKPDILVGMLKQ
jgi:glycerophosphoryl diester phosphodiesterase